MRIHNIEQGTQEWFDVRALKMTASHAQAIATAGKGLKTYVLNVVSEYYSTAEQVHYSNEHTERGHELEPLARSMYELLHDVTVEEVGFVELSQYVGCSPDGLVGEEGLIEIKCPQDAKYFLHLVEGEKAIDSSYLWQMQMQLYVTGRAWCDYVAYNPNYAQPLYVKRIEKDSTMVEKIKKGLEKGEKIIKEFQIIINNYNI